MPRSSFDPPIATPAEPEPGGSDPLELQPPTPGTGAVTMGLIITCAAVALWSSLGGNIERRSPFLISLWPSDSPAALSEVRAGQIWRLFTPAFIHFGIAHLIFNMLGMQSLGTAVEARNGRVFYLVLIVILAGTTDLAQYYATGPGFGGMSGVLYGLFGYVWLRSVCDPTPVIKCRERLSLLVSAGCYSVMSARSAKLPMSLTQQVYYWARLGE